MEKKINPLLPSTGEKVVNVAKIFLMGYGAYRLAGDILKLGSRLFRRTRRMPRHGES